MDFHIKLMTNESRPLSIAERVNEYQTVEIVDGDTSSDDEKDNCPDDEPASLPSQFEIEDVIETLKKLTLRPTQSLIFYCHKCQLRSTIEEWLIGKQTKIMDFYEKKMIFNIL